MLIIFLPFNGLNKFDFVTASVFTDFVQVFCDAKPVGHPFDTTRALPVALSAILRAGLVGVMKHFFGFQDLVSGSGRGYGNRKVNCVVVLPWSSILSCWKGLHKSSPAQM